MSLARAIVARADGYADLHSLIGERIFRQGAIQNVDLPFIEFDIISSDPALTFGDDQNDITKARVQVSLYAETATALDDLEVEWRRAFAGYRGTVGGLRIDSWIESAYDDEVDARITDIQARVYRRVIDNMFAFIEAAGSGGGGGGGGGTPVTPTMPRYRYFGWTDDETIEMSDFFSAHRSSTNQGTMPTGSQFAKVWVGVDQSLGVPGLLYLGNTAVFATPFSRIAGTVAGPAGVEYIIMITAFAQGPLISGQRARIEY